MGATADRIVTTPFAKVYPMCVQKAERRTGFDRAGLEAQIERQTDLSTPGQADRRAREREGDGEDPAELVERSSLTLCSIGVPNPTEGLT